MAIISCPHCSGKLRFPDDMAPRRVKCPSCGQSFLAGPKGAQGESSASSISKRKPEPPKPPAKKDEPPANAFAFDDEPGPSKRRRDEDDDRPRRRRDEDEEDDDRPSAKRRRDEDEEDDDRPRRRRRDDDDDDDDRPRARRRGRDEDDDDEDDDRPRRGKVDDTKAQYGYARTGIGLAGIGFWCQVGALGVILFMQFLAIVANEYVRELRIPAGLAGLANWVLGAVGFSFLIAGPRKGNLFGLSIALVAVTAVHFFLVIYVGFGDDSSDLSFGYGRRRATSVHWEAMPTVLDSLVGMILIELFTTSVLIAALFEIARFVLFTLVLKEYAQLVKSRDLKGSASLLLIGQPSVLGISLVLFLILRLIAKNSSLGTDGKYLLMLMLLLEYGGYIAVYVMSALACLTAKSVLYKKK